MERGGFVLIFRFNHIISILFAVWRCCIYPVILHQAIYITVISSQKLWRFRFASKLKFFSGGNGCQNSFVLFVQSVFKSMTDIVSERKPLKIIYVIIKSVSIFMVYGHFCVNKVFMPSRANKPCDQKILVLSVFPQRNPISASIKIAASLWLQNSLCPFSLSV